MRISDFWGRCLSLFAPDACANCDNNISHEEILFCPACKASASFEPVNVRLRQHTVVAAGQYRGPLALAIRKLKYEARTDLAAGLGQLMQKCASERGLLTGVCLVPVPCHPLRLSERGYNQAALLATAIARGSGNSVVYRALARTRDSAKHAQMSRAERERDSHGLFLCRQQLAQPVLLVDDVVTTGTTAHACIQAMESQGCRVKGVLAAAYTGEKERIRILPPDNSKRAKRLLKDEC